MHAAAKRVERLVPRAGFGSNTAEAPAAVWRAVDGGFRSSDLREVDALNGAFLMVRRAAMDEVGLIDERFFMYGDDLDWCVRFGKAGWPLVFFPGAEIVHYGGGSSSRAPVYFYVEMHRANLQYFQKHHSWLAQRGFLAGLLLHDTIRYIGFSALSLLGPRWREKVGLKAQRSMACIQWVCARRSKPWTRVRRGQAVSRPRADLATAS